MRKLWRTVALLAGLAGCAEKGSLDLEVWQAVVFTQSGTTSIINCDDPQENKICQENGTDDIPNGIRWDILMNWVYR